MKKTFPIALLCLAAGLALPSVGAPALQEQEALDGRVAALEVALAKEQKAHAETRALLDQTIEYVRTQAQTAEKMMAVLDAAEAAGFTAGINFRSREILLGGFRDVWSTAQKDVPGGKQAPQQPARR